MNSKRYLTVSDAEYMYMYITGKKERNRYMY